MKDNIKGEIRHLYDLLQHRNKWYLDFTCPDNPEIQNIAEIAKSNADSALSEISFTALYGRYQRWAKGPPHVNIFKGESDEKYFDIFLSDEAFDLAEKSLKGSERKIFQESVNLFIMFL
jgi:hypothetical protein